MKASQLKGESSMFASSGVTLPSMNKQQSGALKAYVQKYIPQPYAGSRLDTSTLGIQQSTRPNSKSVKIERRTMHISGLHENDGTQLTAHQALKKTLDLIP